MVAIACLFRPDPTAATSYRGVYRDRAKPDLFRSMFKAGNRLKHLGYFRTETAAARRVAEEYEAVFGPGWESLFREADRRKRRWYSVRSWHVVVKRPGRRPRRKLVGYTAAVWEWGREVTLGDHLHPADRRRDRPRGRPWLYPTPGEARRAAEEWGRRTRAARWGLLAHLALWRG